MGLFEKKFCVLCGEKAGLFTRAKLSDGYLCGKCEGKCSDYLTNYGDMTKEDIEAHLKAREENKALYDQFRETESVGCNDDIRIDGTHGWFVVAHGGNYNNGNPDVFSFDQIMRSDTRETFETIHPDNGPDHPGADPNGRPNRPPIRRLDHLYVRIVLDHPYAREIEFDALNRIAPTPYEIDEAYRSARNIEDALMRMHRHAQDYQAAPEPESAKAAAHAGGSAADEILKWKQLLDMGAITQEEFDQKKKQLLGL